MNKSKIEKIFESLTVHSDKYTYNARAVSEVTREEYYKNGNIKSRISILRINEPKECIIVKNKDYYLYSENRNKSIKYLNFVHQSYMYEKYVKVVWSDLSSIHNTKINLFDDINFLEKKALKENEKNKVELKIQKLDELFKPTMNQEKYQRPKKRFNLFFTKRKNRKIEEEVANEFLRDLNDYSESLVKYKQQSYNNARIKYNYYIGKSKYKEQKNIIIDKYKNIKKGYYMFKESEKANEYFDLVLNNYKTKQWFYKGYDHKLDVDIDSKCMYLDLQIPPKNIYPVIEKFKVIKKTPECKGHNYKAKDREAYVTSALNSYILFFVNLVKIADYEEKINYLVMNLFTDEFSLNSEKCNKTIRIELDKVGKYKEYTAGRQISNFIGYSLKYSDLESSALKIKKEGF